MTRRLGPRTLTALAALSLGLLTFAFADPSGPGDPAVDVELGDGLVAWAPLDRLATWLATAAEATADQVAAMTVVDWALAGIAVATIWWVVASLRASTRLGRVEVEPLECDDDSAPVKSLTAALRERLSDGGIVPPTAVPAGAPDRSLDSVVGAVAPQSELVERALKLLPPPPAPHGYKLATTLTRRRGQEHVWIWLQPKGTGVELLRAAYDPGRETAVRRAADAVQQHVTEHAGEAVPLWARWRDSKAFDRYTEASWKSRDGDDPAALDLYRQAAELEPANLVVRIHMANLVELHAGKGASPATKEDGHAGERVCRAATKDRCSATEDRRAALRVYLRAATIEPRLVEARYRINVLAAALREETSCSHEREWLEQLAHGERKALASLLMPYHTLLREGRLRNELEPRGRARRDLRRSLRVSKRIAGLPTATDEDTGLWLCHWLRALGLFPHLPPWRVRGAWQARYNTACLLAHLVEQAEHVKAKAEAKKKADKEKEKGEDKEQGKEGDDPWPWTRTQRVIDWTGVIDWTAKTARRRALRQIDLAVRESRGALPLGWLLHDDPDFEPLRQYASKDWKLLSERYQPGGPDEVEWEQTPRGLLPDETGGDESLVPDDPSDPLPGPWEGSPPRLRAALGSLLLAATSVWLGLETAVRI